MDDNSKNFEDSPHIAVIGMSGRFPGADTVEKLWRNLCNGVESVTRFSDEELLDAGVDPDLLSNPSYVKAGAVLEDVDMFDTSFFGLTPREAQITDPQQRLFLEEAWNVIERAGYDPLTYPGSVGVFGGTALSDYLLNNLLPNPDVADSVGRIPLILGNDKDSLTTRVAYLLNLTGPCHTVQTYCSTSLVATGVACDNLLNGACDMAVAGGVLIMVPQKAGYLYQEGGIASPDARCRAFDAKAKGAPLGNGVGVVLLKRLEDAVADGDTIHAVIRGWAVNNDGGTRVGYTAPGVQGQTAVILEALANAETDAGSIGYFEAHGTGTALGDAVEFNAMVRAFGEYSRKKQFCAVGSVKTNVGHLDRAAGVTGLIKTVLSVRDGQIPASLNYEEPNPDIDFTDTPFYMNTELRPWPGTEDRPRRAGVSSFGMGGTNAHLIVEQPPLLSFSRPRRSHQLLLVSARSEAALGDAVRQLQLCFETEPQTHLADAAYTLQKGRHGFEHRRILVCDHLRNAVDGLADPARYAGAVQPTQKRPVTFMFSGVGDHYANMGRGLYDTEPVFRRTVDTCADMLRPVLECDLRTVLYPAKPEAPEPAEGELNLRRMLGRDTPETSSESPFHRAAMSQSSVFVVNYALACLWRSWGIEPDCVVGYSLGEYVAACVAGMFSLEDALVLVARRAQMIERLPPGAMVAVPLSAADVRPYLSGEICLAIANGPRNSVLAGPSDAMRGLETRLQADEIVFRHLETSHAVHSTMMSAMTAEFEALLAEVKFSRPDIPYLSNVTGIRITTDEAADPGYWVRHLTQTVRFDSNLAEVLADPEGVVLEIGPGQSLGSFVRQHPDCKKEQWPRILASMRHDYNPVSDTAFVLETLGRLWLTGLSVDWDGFYGEERRQRIALPTYPFQKQRYWIDPPDRPATAAAPAGEKSTGRKDDIPDWFYEPVWERAEIPAGGQALAKNWLIFGDAGGVGSRLAELVGASRERDVRVALVRTGPAYTRHSDSEFIVNPDRPGDYATLIKELAGAGQTPAEIVHAWSVGTPEQTDDDPVIRFQSVQRTGFYSLLYLARAMGSHGILDNIRLTVVSDSMQPVGDTDTVPEKATITGLLRTIPQEYQNIRCRSVDLEQGADTHLTEKMLLAEIIAPVSDKTVAFRGGERLVQKFRSAPKLRLASEAKFSPETLPLKPHGVYLITGGLGAVGLILAEYLARNYQAGLILTGRSGLPDRDTWPPSLSEGNYSAAHKIRKVLELEALGAEVLPVAADVGSEQQMSRAVSEAYERFGDLNGVIHAAGMTDETAFQLIQQSESHVCERHFLPKVYGLYVLDRVLGDRPLDFFLCFSSLSAILGGLALGPYASANSFMDAYVHRHNSISPASRTKWMTVDWDNWQAEERPDSSSPLAAAVTEFEMTPEEGTQAFAMALGSGHPHLVHSTGDLHERIRQWVDLETPDASDRQICLAAAARPELTTEYVPAANDYEKRIAGVWQNVLGIDQVGIHDNFFDMGGNSLIGLQVIGHLQKEFGTQIPAVALFEAPTVSTLAEYLRPEDTARAMVEPAEADRLTERRRAFRMTGQPQASHQDIAIIGTTGRFPGADSVEKFWQNLCDGIESVTQFTDEELLASGVSARLIGNPNYVKARPVIEGTDMFDGFFFGYSPREAELTDPQHRVFMECCWEALELAGYSSEKYRGMIGVFGGTNLSGYLMRLSQDPLLFEKVGADQIVIGNDKDSLTTAVSYKLNLTGPSFSVQTFCSTSLVATHLACRSLLDGECDMALAGGVSIRVPQKIGHLYAEGGMGSPDRHCRTFDARAKGTLFGDGVSLVVLKRLAEAVEDGDTIHAVIRASAVNNDGSMKVSYTAPSVTAQARVIADALECGGIDPESIGYVEAHGTATELGDPIEVTALTRAWRRHTAKKQFCAIGSLKTNVGHLDRAAGVAGLIKAALTVKTGTVPPTLHFQKPNPELDLENSPFYVNTELSPWPLTHGPRRAGVSSLGMGGTNAHLIVEEPPQPAPASSSRPAHLLLLSARSETALNTATDNLVHHLEENPGQDLADIAHTLQLGRASFEHRRIAVCRNTGDAAQSLKRKSPERVFTRVQAPVNRSVVFMFPGVGDHYLHMAEELYETEPVFEQCIEDCCRILRPYLGERLRDLLYPPREEKKQKQESTEGISLRAMLGRENVLSPAAEKLNRTEIIQPVTFAVEYALANLLMSWGIRPRAMVGHSLGEYVAACLSGVLSLRDALKLVAERARLIQESEEGSMIAVPLSAEEIRPFLSDDISFALHNGQATCVLGGSPDAVVRVGAELGGRGIAYRELPTTHAFHSDMMLPLAERLTEIVRTVRLNPPTIPYISDVTGDWITPKEACDPDYWARHMCRTVRFFRALEVLLADDQQVLLEVGPGQSLGSFAKQHPGCKKEQFPLILPTMRYSYNRQSDMAFLLEQLGKLWLAGMEPDWEGFYQNEKRRRVPLPTYPFERERYWLEPKVSEQTVSFDTQTPEEIISALPRNSMDEWFFMPGWKQTAPLSASSATAMLSEQECWLIFSDRNDEELGEKIGAWLTSHGQEVVFVRPGKAFDRSDEGRPLSLSKGGAYTVRPCEQSDYTDLFGELNRLGLEPSRIVHLWNVYPPGRYQSLEERSDRSFYSLMVLVKALGETVAAKYEITVISDNLHPVIGKEHIIPEKAMLIGPCRVIPLEYANIACRGIDIILPEAETRDAELLFDNLMGELMTPASPGLVALRGRQRWAETFEPCSVPEVPGDNHFRLRENGTYLITGGLGGIGMALAEFMADTVHARLILAGRAALPSREDWPGLLGDEDTDSGILRKIKGVLHLEELGATVMTASADVGDEAQMQALGDRISREFGTLNGVIHAAGLPGMGLTQLKTPETAAEVLAPKVAGTLFLEKICRDSDLDFLVLFSSVTSALGGGPGQIDYCAANAFLDAYAQSRAGEKCAVVAVNWGEWQWNAWDEGLSGYDKETQAFFRENRARFGIAFEEGTQVLRRIMGTWLPQIVVSTQDFNAMVRLARHFTAARILKQMENSETRGTKHNRPDLGVSYVAPRNDLEQTLARVWSDILSIEEVGIHDNFFDLGGNSLVGISLIAKLRQQPDMPDIPIHILYEASSVAAMARYLQPDGQATKKIAEQQDRGEKRRQHLLKQQKSRQNIRLPRF